MKCDACGQEVALAKVCPYCGSKVDPTRPEEEETAREPRGEFRGRVDDGSAFGRRSASSGLAGLGQIIRFLLEPRIAPWQKALFLIGVFYVLSPIDLLPGAFLPVVGWFDDLAVVAVALRLVASALERLDHK